MTEQLFRTEWSETCISSREDEQDQGVYIVHLSVVQLDKAGGRAAQVHERLQIDGGLGLEEHHPREECTGAWW